MLGMVGVLTAAICTSCVDQQNPTGLRLGVPQPTVEQHLSDGCARFQVRFDAGGAPIIEPIFNTGTCALNELRLLSDTAGSFDAATGTLRVAVVMENIGTTAVIPGVRLFFNADSVQRLNAQGEPVPGTPDILAYQPDSVEAGGRRARWFWDQWLAVSGQPQVLQPGTQTQRRWVEFRGTGWTERVRLKLFAWGAKQSAVPAMAPDTLPAGLINSLPNVSDAANRTLKSQIVMVIFREGTSQSLRQAAVDAVGGQVIGGIRSILGEGLYYLRIGTATTASSLHNAASLLEGLPQVAVVYLLDAVPQDISSYRRPSDGPLMHPADWSIDRRVSSGANWALERIEAPLAWGCTVGSPTVRVSVVDLGFNAIEDLSNNIAFLGEHLQVTTGRFDHGTEVASVIGAVGSNGIGSTGVSWQVALDLRNYKSKPPDYAQQFVPADGSPIPSDFLLQENIVAAGTAGARIIVLTSNIPWRTKALRVPV